MKIKIKTDLNDDFIKCPSLINDLAVVLEKNEIKTYSIVIKNNWFWGNI